MSGIIGSFMSLNPGGECNHALSGLKALSAGGQLAQHSFKDSISYRLGCPLLAGGYSCNNLIAFLVFSGMERESLRHDSPFASRIHNEFAGQPNGVESRESSSGFWLSRNHNEPLVNPLSETRMLVGKFDSHSYFRVLRMATLIFLQVFFEEGISAMVSPAIIHTDVLSYGAHRLNSFL